MKKQILMLAMAAAASFAVSAPAYSAEGAPVVPDVSAAVEAAADSPHVQYMEKAFELVGKLNAVLVTVNDKASADAAAAQIAELGKEMEALSAEAEKLGEPDAAAAVLIQQKSAEHMGTLIAFAMKMMQIQQADYYGSEALKGAMPQEAMPQE